MVSEWAQAWGRASGWSPGSGLPLRPSLPPAGTRNTVCGQPSWACMTRASATPRGFRSAGCSASSSTRSSTTSPSTTTSRCCSWTGRWSTAPPSGPSACPRPTTPSPPARPSGSPAGATRRRQVSGGRGSARNCTAVGFGGFVAVLLSLPFPHGFPGLTPPPRPAPSDGQDTLTTVSGCTASHPAPRALDPGPASAAWLGELPMSALAPPQARGL